MIKGGLNPNDPEIDQPLPHQTTFLEKFLLADSPAFHLLVTPPGVGKTTTAIRIVRTMVAEKNAEHILIITPAEVTGQYQVSLENSLASLPVEQVNRKRLRELAADLSVGVNPLEAPVIALMTMPLAQDEYIAETVSGILWDLVIIEEAHHLVPGSKLESLIKLLIGENQVKRLLLISTMLRERRAMFIPEGTEVTEWTLAMLVDWNGQPIIFEPKRQIIEYQRNQQEVAFLNRLQESQNLVPVDSIDTRRSLLLVRQASSSLFAVQKSLISLRNRAVHDIKFNPILASREESTELDDMSPNLDAMMTETKPDMPEDTKLVESLVELIDLAQKVSVDNKLEALRRLLKEQRAIEPRLRICICSSYSSTLYYLSSALKEELGKLCLIVGSIPPKEVAESIDKHREEGGPILVSQTVLGGIDWRNLSIDMLINYDLPGGRSDMQRRRLIVSSKETGTMWAFRDRSNALPHEADLLRLHEFDTAKFGDTNSGTSQMRLFADE